MLYYLSFLIFPQGLFRLCLRLPISESLNTIRVNQRMRAINYRITVNNYAITLYTGSSAALLCFWLGPLGLTDGGPTIS